MQGADLTPAAKLLLVAYALHLSPDGTPTQSWRQLGKICGIDDRTAYRERRNVEGLRQNVLTHRTKSPNGDYDKMSQPLGQNVPPLARVLINNKEISNTRSTGACACEGLADFCAHYPKRTFANTATVRSAWTDCLAEGITAAELMRCLELAKMSKAWQEQDGRYIPKAHVWLHERRFDADLQRIRAERQLRDDTRRREREAEEMNALIYGGWNEDE